MPVDNFNNKTGLSKFMGRINYQGFDYDYVIYLTPLTNEIEKNEIINYFGNRIYKGKLCLGTNEETIINLINNGDVSAFFIVKVVNMDNVASGSLQIYNWCEIVAGPDVWINDVCKISTKKIILQEKSSKGSTGVPVDVMFMLMEQLAVQNLNKNIIKLFVEEDPENPGNAQFLVPRYKNIGFSIDKFCTSRLKKQSLNYIVMKKKIESNKEIIDFNFLLKI